MAPLIDGDLTVALSVPDTPNVAGELQIGLDISATRTRQLSLDLGAQAVRAGLGGA